MDKLKYVKFELPDGSYIDSIPLAIDTNHIEINNNMNLAHYIVQNDINIKNLQDDYTDIADALARLTKKYPVAASSVSDMIDPTVIYVNIADNYWYYYDNNTWNKGGLFQATVDWDWDAMYQQMSDNMETATSEGEDLTLTGCANWRMKSEIEGNTEQKSYTGKNLCHIDDFSTTIRDLQISSNNNVLTFNGTNTDVISAIDNIWLNIHFTVSEPRILQII